MRIRRIGVLREIRDCLGLSVRKRVFDFKWHRIAIAEQGTKTHHIRQGQKSRIRPRKIIYDIAICKLRLRCDIIVRRHITVIDGNSRELNLSSADHILGVLIRTETLGIDLHLGAVVLGRCSGIHKIGLLIIGRNGRKRIDVVIKVLDRNSLCLVTEHKLSALQGLRPGRAVTERCAARLIRIVRRTAVDALRLVIAVFTVESSLCGDALRKIRSAVRADYIVIVQMSGCNLLREKACPACLKETADFPVV